MNEKYRLAIFASGSGTNAERFFTYFKDHGQIEISLLLSNNPNAFVLQRAKKAGVPTKVFDKKQLEGGEVLSWLLEEEITHIILAGFLWLIPDNLIDSYLQRIINIHPALLPRHGGKGMYGSKVHEAVKAANETETGITIHLVNQHYDEGAIIFQAKTTVDQEDTPDEIAHKVHELEYKHYPAVVEGWVLGNYSAT
ncbi:MAG: phosphoribosylglycinamide formyltransferase [Cyclobacteriaceae bacterium]|nr:phosphoribosylglycinamide formyltransferase [Cyclobacteriaceae bacterium]